MIDIEHVDFVGIPTQDVERSKRFYGGTLALVHEQDTPGGAEYRAGQVTLSISSPETSGKPFERTPSGLALRVPDVGAARTELERAGVLFDGPTIDTGVCHMALPRDPDDNRLILHRRYAPLAARLDVLAVEV